MDFFSGEIQNHRPKHDKRRLTRDQVAILEESFVSDRKLEPERKLQLASQLGVPPRQIAVWYQNRRARWKTQSLEMDCAALQLKLENTMAEKRKLERDVERLKSELRKIQEMSKYRDTDLSKHCSTDYCVGESGKGASCLQGGRDSMWGNFEGLQPEELYAPFMEANRSSFQPEVLQSPAKFNADMFNVN